MKEKTKKICICVSVMILILIDQIIKYIIEYNQEVLPLAIIKDFLQISYYQNTGIAFGIGTGNIVVFIICNIIIIGIIFKFIISQNQRLDNKNKFILSLVLARWK